jgi:serine/threonine protein kinase
VDEVRNLATGAVFARKTTTFPKQREQSSFMTEIEIMKKLDHPHILRFVDAYTLDNSVSILMSPVPDFDLDYLMSKHPTAEPIPVDTITQWFTCLASSVKYLHENSIKHQDIKPSNILIKGQTVFLADFGTAKTFVDSNSTVSTSGDMTMKYCSPETALQGMRGRKADIFSLGCVFLEMFNLLIPQGYSKFEHFQDCHSIGGGTYHESLLMVELWVGDLRREPIFEAGSILRQLLHTCQGMLRESRKDRPSAADLSASLPLGKCCLLAENEADSKPTLQEKRTSSSMPRPLFHNSPQSAHLDHQIPTASEQASQRKPSSKRGCDSLSPQITLKSAILEVAHPKKNHWWSSWSLILESIGCNYIPMLLLILTSCSWFLYLPPTPSLRKARGHAPPRSISSAKFESRQSELTELLSYSEDTAIPTAFLGARTILQRLSIATASQPEIPLVRPSSDISYKIHFSGPAVQGKTFDRIEQSWLENTVSQTNFTLPYTQPLIITFRTMTKLLRI